MPSNNNKKNQDPNKPKRTRKPHTEATKAKIREKRNLRGKDNQPRNISQSSKRKSFYDELVNDVKTDKAYKKVSKKDKEILLAWLENNKHELGHIDNPKHSDEVFEKSHEMGIENEFTEMYKRTYEFKVGDMIFDSDSFKNLESNQDDPFNIVSGIEESEGDFFSGDFDEVEL
jgi:hypothetical protein